MNIGAVTLSEHAKALEFAAKNGNTDYITENHKKLLDEYCEILDKLRAALQSK